MEFFRDIVEDGSPIQTITVDEYLSDYEPPEEYLAEESIGDKNED